MDNQDRQNTNPNPHLSQILANTPNYVYWKDRNGVYLGSNDSHAQLVGLKSGKALVGKSDYEISWRKQAYHIRRQDLEVMESESPQTMEKTLTLSNGHTHIFLINKVPLKDNNGNITGVLGISTNITRIKEMERVLSKAKHIAEQGKRTTEIYLENIITNLPAHVYWKNLDGIYLGCNERHARHAGLENADQIVGKTDVMLPWAQHSEYITKIERQIIESGEPRHYEDAYHTTGGEERTFLIQKVPLRNESRQIIGILGISMDITERKAVEEQLRQTKIKAESANQAKTEFMANMSHDLRTPLNGILGSAHALKVSDATAEQQELIDNIEQSSHVLLRLVEDILSFSKLESGKWELCNDPFDIKHLVEEVTSVISAQVTRKNLNLIVDYNDDVPRYLVGDPYCLRRILVNLLNNAVKFTERGHIILSVELVENSTQFVTLKISVSDTGIGIPKEKQEIIFEKFSRLDPAYKGRHKGTGLGLTIVKQLVTMLNGTIELFSKESEGSSFTCTLNFDLQELDPDISAWQQYYENLPILIVDDHAVRAEVTKKQLTKQTEISSSEHAIENLVEAQRNHTPFCIAIIDDEIKSISPNKIAQKILSSPELKNTMLMITSQPSTLAEVKEIKKAGFFKQLIKPVQPSELVESIATAWEKWANRDEIIKI